MDIKDKIKNAPKYPGCYLYKDDKDQVIYVGMSKFLPKRVSSYFTKKHDDKKTRTLVEQIRDVEYQIASSEAEALLMEEELIKLYQPKFNIKGKDDKKRTWFMCLTKEPYPKLQITHGKLEGFEGISFTSGQLAYEVFNLIHDILPVRTCSYNLLQENIDAKKFKPCLEYQLGRCEAPCQGLQSSFQHMKMTFIIKKVFDLNFKELRSLISSEMKRFADDLNFEKAQDYLFRLKNIDLLEKKLEPVRVRNYNKRAMQIKRTLGLNNLPLIIEAFDNSHNQGDSNVAASVRYVNNRPQKSEYRKYIIRDENNNGNDCASFQEVVYRRFKRILDEKGQLPDLVVIDGGKGQLNTVKGVFEDLNLSERVDLISISKDDKHRSKTIHTTDGKEYDVSWSELGVIQEEIHRFAIKFHRERSSKKLFQK
jgi:excinuclease UvrABC nuclease subunit